MRSASLLWQPSFCDRALRTVAEYTEKLDYIRLNRVRAGLVGHSQKKPQTSNPAVCATNLNPSCEIIADMQECLVVRLKVPLEVPAMATVPDIIPITDLRQDAAAALKRVKSSRQPVVITQRGRATAVLLSLEAYERSEQERQILRHLARGEQEIKAGKGFDLDEVLAEADNLLAGGPE